MKRERHNRIAARIGIIKLRCLLAADAHITLQQTDELINLTAEMIGDPDAAASYKSRIFKFIKSRFGRNPDTFELSPATVEALSLLDSIQQGTASDGSSPQST